MIARTVARTSWHYDLFQSAHPQLATLYKRVTKKKDAINLPGRLLACRYRAIVVLGLLFKLATLLHNLALRIEVFLAKYLSPKSSKIISISPLVALYLLFLSLMVFDTNPYLNENPVTDPNLASVLFVIQLLFVLTVIGIPIFIALAIKYRWPLKTWIMVLEKKICHTEIEFIS